MRLIILTLASLLFVGCASMSKSDRGPASFPCPMGKDLASGICVSNEVESKCSGPSAEIGYSTIDNQCYALETLLVPKIYDGAYHDCPPGYQRIGVGVTYDKKNAWACRLIPTAK